MSEHQFYADLRRVAEDDICIRCGARIRDLHVKDFNTFAKASINFGCFYRLECDPPCITDNELVIKEIIE